MSQYVSGSGMTNRGNKSYVESALHRGENQQYEIVSDAFNELMIDNFEKNPTGMWIESVKEGYLNFTSDTENNIQAWRSVSGRAFENFVQTYYNHRLPEYLQIATPSELNATFDNNFTDLVVYAEHKGNKYPFIAINTMTSVRSRLDGYTDGAEAVQESGMNAVVITLDASDTEGELSQTSDTNELMVDDPWVFDGLYSFNVNTDDSMSEMGVYRVGDTRYHDLFVEHVLYTFDQRSLALF